MNYMTIIIIIFATLIGALGSYYMKKGAEKITKSIFSFVNWSVIIGVALYLLGTVIYLLLLKTNDLSILYPMTSLTYIWVLLISKHFLNEKLNKSKIYGIVLIIVGVFLLR